MGQLVRRSGERDRRPAPSGLHLHARVGHGDGYLAASARPLHILVFLLPLIIAYEIGSQRYLGGATGGLVEDIRARSLMLGFFQELGVLGRFVPAAMLVCVLLTWHLLNRDRWTIKPLYLLGMLVESLVWTVPLLVAIALIQLAAGGGTLVPASGPTLAETGPGSIWALSVHARVTISLGAGLYEEFLFRMIGLTLLHMVLVDLLRLHDTYGTILGILISAVAFALYHDITGPSGAVEWPWALAWLAAGVYFGLVYIMRGFALVVGVHALYDLFVLVVFRSD